jgi:Kef-type K+ transport system membrane component KefB
MDAPISALHIPSLLWVLIAAALAPLIGEATRKLALPMILIELVLGVAIGPQCLALATVDGPLPFMAKFGVAFLFFLAGLEIDLRAIGSTALRSATLGWALIMVLSCLAAFAMQSAGLIQAWSIVAIALGTTALGILVPILRDAKELETPFGNLVMATGVVGELGPILAMSIVLARHHTVVGQTLLTIAFIIAVLLVAWAALTLRIPAFLQILRRTMTQSSQLPVRICVLLLGVLVVLATNFGLDLALGALAAGMIVGLATLDGHGHVLQHKMDAVGFGVFVPVFFIVSGMTLDIKTMFSSASRLMLTGVFLTVIVLVRLPIVLLQRRELTGRKASALGLYSATTLSLIVVLAQTGVERGLMTTAEATPLVSAGILTVLLFPSIAAVLAGRRDTQRSAASQDSL